MPLLKLEPCSGGGKSDQEVIDLWDRMNSWVYSGFEQTFSRLGVDFEKHYKESAIIIKTVNAL